MASYLPPVVTVFTGDIGDLLAKIAAAKAAIADLRANALKDITIRIDTSGIAGAIAKTEAMNAAFNRGRTGVRLWGVGLMGWIKIIHNLFMVFGSQLIADTIGLVAFGIAAVQTLGPVISNVKNLGAAWSTYSGAQKVAAVNLRNFMDRLGNHDLQVVTVFDTFLQLISAHMRSTGGVVQQASNAFLNFAADIKTAMNSPAWQKFLGANTGVIQQDLSLLFKTLVQLATTLVSLAHNFNFMGVWALTGFGMILKGIEFLNEANPTLARFVLLTLAAYHALKFLAGTRLVAWAAAATGGLSGLTGAFRNFRMFGLVPTLGFMTGMSAAAISLTGGLALVFAALAGGVIIAKLVGDGFSNILTQNQAMIRSMTQTDHAVGLNIAGYEKLASQIGAVKDRLIALHAGQVLVGQAAGRYVTLINQDSAAQQAAANTARILTANFGFLEHRFGLTQTQAYQVAKQLGLLNNIGKQVFSPQDRANITSYMNTLRASQNPMTALKFDMQQAANATLGLTNQIQGLTNAFNVLAAPFASTMQNTVTWKNDNITLAKAVAGANGKVGYMTAAQRTAAAALSTSITDTINLSQSTLQSTHSYDKAAGVILKEIGVLKGLHSQSALVKRAIQILQQQLNSLHDKTVNIRVNYSTTGGIPTIGAPGTPGGGLHGPQPGAVLGPSVAAGGGNQGSPMVIENHIFLDSREIFGATQKRAVRRQKRNGFNGLTRVIR